MIDKIIEFSAKNKFIVIFFTIAAIVAAVYSIRNIPLDAIPDLSDTQVIIYSQWDRSPDIVEDQVTYPIVTAMLGAPGVKECPESHALPCPAPFRDFALDLAPAQRLQARCGYPVADLSQVPPQLRDGRLG